MALLFLSVGDLERGVDPEWLLDAADDDRDGAADAAIVDAALAAAEGEVLAALAGRYAIASGATVPDVLRGAGVALAAEALAARRPGLTLGEGLAARVRVARELLGAIRRGDIALPSLAATARAESTTRGIEPPVRAGAHETF